MRKYNINETVGTALFASFFIFLKAQTNLNMKRIIAFAAAALILSPAFPQKTLKSAYADAFKMGCAVQDPLYQLEEFETYLDPYKNGLPDDVQQQLTARYAELFNIFYERRDKIDRVTIWGLHDGMSWKNGYPIPNRTNYPLLFNRDRSPKPALEAVLNIPNTIGTVPSVFSEK